MRLTSCIVLIALNLTTACTQSGLLSAPGEGPPRPRGMKAVQTDVDGLIVGHRLMEAGEYELALRAYYRAASVQGLNADTLSAIGSANLKLARLGQAEENLRQAIKADEKFAAAWNNLGVVLMEQGHPGEARKVFQIAFALDSGESADIRENLRRAIAQTQNPAYDEAKEEQKFSLVRRGSSVYELLGAP